MKFKGAEHFDKKTRLHLKRLYGRFKDGIVDSKSFTIIDLVLVCMIHNRMNQDYLPTHKTTGVPSQLLGLIKGRIYELYAELHGIHQDIKTNEHDIKLEAVEELYVRTSATAITLSSLSLELAIKFMNFSNNMAGDIDDPYDPLMYFKSILDKSYLEANASYLTDKPGD